MVTIIYNHKEKSMHEQNSLDKGMLSFHKEDKSFSCEASDLDCAGVKDIPKEFMVKIEDNGHTRIFKYYHTKKDDEGEVQLWLYKTSDGFEFQIFND